MKKKFRNDWYFGFFGLFALYGVRELMRPGGDWLDASWIIWIVWFIYFIPVKRK
ncbi:MAG: hypothetical protein KC506_01635 [Nanoarchaeota archaeon]|nr:hypothetical protein [Nanoarchaeota archaeon]